MKVLEPRGTIRLQKRNCKRTKFGPKFSPNRPRDGLYSGGMVGSTKNLLSDWVDVLFRDSAPLGPWLHSYKSKPM